MTARSTDGGEMTGDGSLPQGAAGMVWDEALLDKFLENPTRFLPGTRMGYAGIKDAQERADLITYLKKAGGTAQRDAKGE